MHFPGIHRVMIASLCLCGLPFADKCVERCFAGSSNCPCISQHWWNNLKGTRQGKHHTYSFIVLFEKDLWKQLNVVLPQAAVISGVCLTTGTPARTGAREKFTTPWFSFTFPFFWSETMLSLWIDMKLEAIQMVVFDLMSVGVQNLMFWSVMFLFMPHRRLNMLPRQNKLWFN